MPAAGAAKRRLSLSPARCALVGAALILTLSHTGAAFVFGGRSAAGPTPRDDIALGRGVGTAWMNGRSSQQTGSPRGAIWPAIGCVLVLVAARSRVPVSKGSKGASICMNATGVGSYSAACCSLSPRATSVAAPALKESSVFNMPDMDLLCELDEALAVRPSQVRPSEVPSVMVGGSLAEAAAPQHRPGAAKFIGGARRASPRSARRAASSEGNERRHIGARLQANPVVYEMPPLSYDASRVRTKVQASLLMDICAFNQVGNTSGYCCSPYMQCQVASLPGFNAKVRSRIIF